MAYEQAAWIMGDIMVPASALKLWHSQAVAILAKCNATVLILIRSLVADGQISECKSAISACSVTMAA